MGITGLRSAAEIVVEGRVQGVMRVTRDSGCVFVKLVGKYAWES